MSAGHQTEAERIVAQIRAEAYEECARIAEDIGSKHRTDYKRGEHRGDTYYDGASDGAYEASEAIRQAAKGGAA
jgi:vacuolar-type H+-ATPase subunit E/Vma4